MGYIPRETLVKYWSVAQVAAQLGVHTRTVRRWIELGQMPAVRLSGRVLVERAVLAVWARTRSDVAVPYVSEEPK